MAEVRIDIDGSSADFIREMNRARDAVDDVGDAARRSDRDLDDMGGGATTAAGGVGSLKAGAIALGAAIGAAKIKDFAADSINLAIAAEEAGVKFDAVFGPAAQQLGTDLDLLGDRAGIADFRFRDMVGGLGNVLQGFGATREEAVEFSEAMAPLAVDIASFTGNVGDTPGVLNAMTRALLGEREALKGYEIAVLESDVVTQALAETGKETASELTRLEKAQATLTLITERAGVAIGDLDRNMDSAATNQARLRAEWEEMQVAVGDELLAALIDLAPALTGITDAVTNLAPILGTVIGQFVDGQGPLLELTNKITSLTEVLSDSGDELSWWQEGLQNGIKWTMRFLNPVQAAADGVDALNRVFTDGSKASGEMAGKLEEQAAALEDTEQATRNAGDEHQAWEGHVLDSLKALQNLISSEQKLAALRNHQVTALGKVRQASENLDEARSHLATITANNTASEQDLRDAAWEVVEAEAAMAVVSAEFANSQGPMYTDALIDIGREAGLAGDALWAFVEAMLQAQNIGGGSSGGFGGGISLPGLPPGVGIAAHGGIARRGGRTLVGEEGPEIVDLPTGAAVYPNGSVPADMFAGATAGAGSVVFNITVQGFVGSELDLAAEIDRILTRRKRSSGLELL